MAWGSQGSEIFRFLLSKMDGMGTNLTSASAKRVVVVMTCESPKSLPDALIRSGRIELWCKMVSEASVPSSIDLSIYRSILSPSLI